MYSLIFFLFIFSSIIKGIRLHLFQTKSEVSPLKTIAIHYLGVGSVLLVPFRLGIFLRVFVVNSLTRNKILSFAIVFFELLIDLLANLLVFIFIWAIFVQHELPMNGKLIMLISLILGIALVTFLVGTVTLRKLVIESSVESRLNLLLDPLINYSKKMNGFIEQFNQNKVLILLLSTLAAIADFFMWGLLFYLYSEHFVSVDLLTDIFSAIFQAGQSSIKVNLFKNAVPASILLSLIALLIACFGFLFVKRRGV